jgi:hypothetical protein
MRKWILILTVAICIANITKAQSSNYFEDLWLNQPVLHTITSDAPFTVLNYKVVRDFNVDKRDKAQGCVQYMGIFKSIKVNTSEGANSLRQVYLSFDPNEEMRSLRVRAINNDNQVVNLEQYVRTTRMPDGGRAVILRDFQLEKGWELEYEVIVKVYFDPTGSDFLQSRTETDHADFQLIAPKNYTIKIKTTPEVPVTDSSSQDLNYYNISLHHLPAQQISDLYFYLPQLQRVDFSLEKIVEKKDTLRSNWQQFGEENYIPYVSISQPEFKQLQKELQRWKFLEVPMPQQTLIPLVEEFIKSKYTLVPETGTEETVNLVNILATRRAEPIGMTRLINATFYLLNVPTQILLTSARDTIPVDSQILVRRVPKNVLLYFPKLNQALSPTDMSTRFPYYNPLFSGILALRCRDTLIGDQSKVLTDFITTPVAPYSSSNITIEATLNDWTNPVWKLKQSFGGVPATNIRAAFDNAGDDLNSRNKILNAILPFYGGNRRPSDIQLKYEKFGPESVNKAVELLSSLTTPTLVLNTDSVTLLRVGDLIGGTMPTAPYMPPGNIPVQLTFPYYQEKRVNITVPAGLKLRNIDSFNADLSDEKMGYKIKCVQNGQQLNVFVIEYYKEANLNGESKQTFRAIQKKIAQLQKEDMVFVK